MEQQTFRLLHNPRKVGKIQYHITMKTRVEIDATAPQLWNAVRKDIFAARRYIVEDLERF